MKYHCPKNPNRTKRTFKKTDMSSMEQVYTREELFAAHEDTLEEVQSEKVGLCVRFALSEEAL